VYNATSYLYKHEVVGLRLNSSQETAITYPTILRTPLTPKIQDVPRRARQRGPETTEPGSCAAHRKLSRGDRYQEAEPEQFCLSDS